MMDLFNEPSASNLAWRLVTAVLPSDASLAWGQTLQVFTSTLFAFCAVVIAYNTISGIVQSAYTGRTLGDRWHQIWTPLRIIVGVGLLIPMPSTGFSPAHYLLRDVIARGGINLADASWGVFVKTVASGETTILPTSSSGSTVAMTVLQHEICAAVYNRAGATWGWQARLPNPAGDVTGLGIPGYQSKVSWSYGPTCGHFSYTIPDDRASFANARREAVAEMVSAYRTEAQRYAALAAETSGLSSADAVTKAISGKVLSSAIVQDIRARGATFDAKVSEAAKFEAATVEAELRARLCGERQAGGLPVRWIVLPGARSDQRVDHGADQ